MKVGELRTLLEDFDDDLEVVLSKDAEGNGFSHLEEVTIGYYIPESSWSGDFVSEDESEEDEMLNLNGAEEAIALWPTN